jgi:hypothetical protein
LRLDLQTAAGGRDTRADLALAARALFASLGFERTTMRAVATRAGVDAGLIYHHFGIPTPVIGGLIFVIGGELLWGRREDIQLVVRTAKLETVAMLATFLATTQFPLQNAILFGAGLSLILFCAEASRQGHPVRRDVHRTPSLARTGKSSTCPRWRPATP